MSYESRIAGLDAALVRAAELDAEQRHAEAVLLLDKAISDSNDAWDPAEPEGSLTAYAQKVQDVALERERQHLRAARWRAYLNT